MKCKLKNGNSIFIRKPTIEDALGIINIISTADTETKFLTRNPNEFNVTEEQEKEFIRNILEDDDQDWFVAEYEGQVVGQCSVGLIKRTERCRHRAEVTFVILKKYCGMGIGGKLMQQCINWCKDRNVTQIELSVVADNKQAINMYENFGFKTTGTVPKAMRYDDGTFADELFMILEL